MSYLHVSLFGSMQVSKNFGDEQIHLTRSTQGLLAYLLLQRNRSHPREVLANLFWSDSTGNSARSCLNTTLWRLRKVLENGGIPQGTYLMIDQTGEIGFNASSDYWLDVAEFEAPIRRLLTRTADQITAADEQAFEHCAGLYQGDLLDGFYHDWALRARENLRILYLNGLAHMMRHYSLCTAYEKSLMCGQRILAIDPLREEVHRQMMHLYVESGQRVLALRQFEYCRKSLEDELKIEPMEETQLLYRQIHDQAAPVTNTRAVQHQESINTLLEQLKQAKGEIDLASERINYLIHSVQDIL